MLRRNFLWYFLLFVAGCTAATPNLHSSSDNSPLKQKEKLRFAVSDVQGMADLQRYYGAFRTALEEVLETKIEFVPVDNFVAATASLHLNLVDIVLAGPAEYIILKARTSAETIVALTRPHYRSVIVVRADSNIKSLADLKGKRIELGKLGTGGSYVGQIKMLMDAGLNPQSDVNIVNSKEYHLKALKNGEVDAWGRTLHRYEKALQQEGASERDYPILVKSPPLPSDVFVASSQLEPLLVAEIRDRMLENQDRLLQAILSVPWHRSKFKGATLAAANDRDYDMIRDVYKAMGEDNFIK
ncbi:MAG: PhnD/SsuA/transferrin family substrate-binding protein [Hormoscilla sp.]